MGKSSSVKHGFAFAEIDRNSVLRVAYLLLMVFEDSTEVCYFSMLSHDAPLIAVRPQPGAWDRDCPGASLPWVWSARFRNTHSP